MEALWIGECRWQQKIDEWLLRAFEDRCSLGVDKCPWCLLLLLLLLEPSTFIQETLSSPALVVHTKPEKKIIRHIFFSSEQSALFLPLAHTHTHIGPDER